MSRTEFGATRRFAAACLLLGVAGWSSGTWAHAQERPSSGDESRESAAAEKKGRPDEQGRKEGGAAKEDQANSGDAREGGPEGGPVGREGRDRRGGPDRGNFRRQADDDEPDGEESAAEDDGGESRRAEEPGKSQAAQKEGTPAEEKPEPRTEIASPPFASQLGQDLPEGLRFNFAAASWQSVLEWLAAASQLNLNWSELPPNELNLITQETYTLDQARDILNMHLLSQGFTLLQKDETLFLTKLDDSLNPTLVPRVEPEELDRLPSYEYVKVSLPLDWMLAETASKELSPLLSPYGKIVPLTTTNRIEAMDAAANLRELRNLLDREQSDQGQQRLVAEFTLQHANALDVLEKLNQLLGLEKPLEKMTRDQMRFTRERMMIDARMMREMGDRAPQPKPKPSDVYLVVNERKNSILANAAPDKIAVIRQAIDSLDAPNSDRGVQLSEITTMRVYPLNGAEADAVSQILEDLRDIGKLHPNARFSEDDDRQILFAYASLQDHMTIQSVMSQLAESSRTFRVVSLRRLKSAYVADSIRTLMTGAESSSGMNERDRWRRRRQSNTATSGFRVESDPPNNRLFLYATDSEFEQVEELLVKLGERSRQSATVRSVQISNDSMEETLRQVQQLWPTISRNPLRMEGDAAGNRAKPSSWPLDNADGADGRQPNASGPRHDLDDAAQRQPPAKAPGTAAGADEVTRTIREVPVRLASHANSQVKRVQVATPLADPGEGNADPADQPAVAEEVERNLPDENAAADQPFDSDLPRRSRAPVEIRQGPNGEIILRSDDPEALDQLEQLVNELAPARKQYTVFRLQHASPYMVQLTLSEIFGLNSLTSTSPIRIVSDTSTMSIMVFGASESELQEMEELIKFYDQPQAVDPTTDRKPRAFRLQHADAQVVADVLKDVYRDLLSANDRALVQPDNGGNGQGRRQGAGNDAPVSVSMTVGNQPRYRGLLSIGTFTSTNTLIISAPQYLMDEIAQTIEQMDNEEAETVTEVVRIDGRVNPAIVAEQLRALLGSPTDRPTPATTPVPGVDAGVVQRAAERGAPGRADSGNGGGNGGGNGSGQRSGRAQRGRSANR
jgi:type II secretory pathway component GspD/PulD (secretin)